MKHDEKNQIIIVAVIISLGIFGGCSVDPENGLELVTPKYFNPPYANAKWFKDARGPIFKDGVMYLATTDANTNRNEARTYFGVSLEMASWAQISFDYKALRGQGGFSVSYYAGKSNLSSPNWTNINLDVIIPDKAAAISVIFFVSGQNQELAVKNLSVKLYTGKARIRDGAEYVPCTGIWIAHGPEHTQHYDEIAAKILRKYIHKFYGTTLPINRLFRKGKVMAGMIVIGEAALKLGLIDKESMNLGNGGYVVKVEQGHLAIGGKSPSGVIAGVYAFLENQGFNFVTADDKDIVINDKKEIMDIQECSLSKSPVFEDLRMVDDGRSGLELGYTHRDYMGLRSCHSLNEFVAYDDYVKEHPEYFALGRDGKRITKDTCDGEVHVCMSNPDVREIVVQKMLNGMEATPESRYYWLYEGDRGYRFCKCSECRKMDIVQDDEKDQGMIKADRNLKFVNAIAERTAKKYPDKILITLAYVDTEKPPFETKPTANVRVMCCPYATWSNNLQTFCAVNTEGFKTLDGWLKICPGNLYIFDYPNPYNECLNIWPAFYATYDRLIYYSKHGVKGIFFCGLGGERPGYSLTVSAGIAFGSLQRYVLSKVLWDPGLDIEREIDKFMKLYFGPAAGGMRAYFNLIHKEVKIRGFVQRHSEIKRGFVTQALSTQAFKCFADAEKAVANDAKYLKRVKTEKLFLLYSDLTDRCRGNGQITEAELPVYAERLAEFARLCCDFEINRFSSRRTTVQWLWETAILKADNPVWYKSSQVQALIKDPLNTLTSAPGSWREPIANGWNIPIISLLGGEYVPEYSFKCPLRKDLKCLRRAGFATSQARAILILTSGDCLPARIELEGMDNDKEVVALMEIVINDKSIYSGRVPFSKNAWKWASFNIPAGVLKDGRNNVEFKNLTSEKSQLEECMEPSWGWYMISGVRVTYGP